MNNAELEQLECLLKSLEGKIINILRGIDQNEACTREGWWETSVSCEFGKQKLEQIKQAFNEEIHLLLLIYKNKKC